MIPPELLNETNLDFLRSWMRSASESSKEALYLALLPKVTTRWCPHVPTLPQSEFIGLKCKEALYGGAAGGGKSDALLASSLRYVDRPGYSAILFRRTYPQLQGDDGLIARSHEWLRGAAKWKESRCRWYFPSGATLSFSHLQHEKDLENHQGPAYHFVGFDELTHFTFTMYSYFFTRLRRRVDHSDIPLRIRGATNPGGIGHQWVMKRFLCKAFIRALMSGERGVFWKDGRAFIPARIADNKYLDYEEYIQQFGDVDPILRARLLSGDWSVNLEGKIKQEWIRYYRRSRGGYYDLLRSDGSTLQVVKRSDCFRLMIVDPAGTSEDEARKSRGHEPSWSVIGVFDIHWHGGVPQIILVDLWRKRCDYPALLAAIRSMHAKHSPDWSGIENEKLGKAAIQLMRDYSFTLNSLATEGKDKVVRAAYLLNYMEAGSVFFPEGDPFVENLELEMLSWTGLDSQASDQIDVAAYAARWAKRHPMSRNLSIASPHRSIDPSHGQRMIPMGATESHVDRATSSMYFPGQGN